jgi:hypothetical protein
MSMAFRMVFFFDNNRHSTIAQRSHLKELSADAKYAIQSNMWETERYLITWADNTVFSQIGMLGQIEVVNGFFWFIFSLLTQQMDMLYSVQLG